MPTGKKTDDLSLEERSPPVNGFKTCFKGVRPWLARGRHSKYSLIFGAPHWRAKEKDINIRARAHARNITKT